MNNLFRGLIAGFGAYKLGGGCISTVLIFILIWWLLGTCGAMPPPQETIDLGGKVTTVTVSYAPATTSPIASGIAVS